MQEFNSLQEAFAWFIENTFPKLPTPEKRKLKDIKYVFTQGKYVSERKMLEIFEKYGFEVEIKVFLKNKQKGS